MKKTIILLVSVLLISCDHYYYLDVVLKNNYSETIKLERRNYSDSLNYVVDSIYILKSNASITINNYSSLGNRCLNMEDAFFSIPYRNIIFNDSVSIFYSISDTFSKNMCYGSSFNIEDVDKYTQKATYVIDKEDYQNALIKSRSK